MKKILLATTMFVAASAAAHAEVTLSGDARMGVTNNTNIDNDMMFTSRARVKFTMSGETDGGLSFGASFRAHEAAAANGNTNTSAGSVFISGAFGKLTMGNVAGAAEAAVGDLSSITLTGLGDRSDTLFLTGDGTEGNEPIIQYAYTAGDLAAYISTTDGATLENRSVGVSYKMSGYSFGLGYESTDDALGLGLDGTHLVASVGGTFGAVAAKAVYGTADIDGDTATQYGASATYTANALAVTGFYKVVDATDVIGSKTTAMGLGASYDLGGRASVKGGIVNADVAGVEDTVYDIGVAFDF